MSSGLKLYIVLSRAYRAVLAHDERDIRSHGLTLTEFAVLELLYHKGPQPLQQIGKRILITSGSITYVVDKLESRGLLYRQQDEKDRRISYAIITAAGHSLIRDIFPRHQQVLEKALAGLTKEEQEIVASLLKKLGQAAEKSLDGSTDRKTKIKK